jgi:hypothetical protein
MNCGTRTRVSSATGVLTAAELRLAYAQRKLRAFIRAIKELQASEFPHQDSKAALLELGQHFQARLVRAERVLPCDAFAVDETLSQINASVSRYTAFLGFLLRSTNVRNAFETYFPLKRLVCQIIEPATHLITSSEWLFIPFTYPMTLDALPNYVLVGAPAPEAGNTLIVPLAGHEIGHSAWRRHRIQDNIKSNFVGNIASALESHPAERDSLVQSASGRPVQLGSLCKKLTSSG